MRVILYQGGELAKDGVGDGRGGTTAASSVVRTGMGCGMGLRKRTGGYYGNDNH